MCGIVGLIGSGIRPDERASAQRMSDVIRHRGPDDEGLWSSADGLATLAHRRLAIIDLTAGGHQPLVQQQTAVVYNGEIYNFRELREELRQKGQSFHTESDTEVLLAAYRVWGTRCVERLNGMFAFAIYDATSQKLFAARDRAGEKPFYYRHEAGRLLFASELKSLFQLKSVPRRLNLRAVDLYFAFGYVPGSECIIEGINKLPPGHTLEYEPASDGVTIKRYWSAPRQRVDVVDEKTLIAELDRLLLDSVRLRLIADVPVGVLLSGGVDSSLVTAMAARASSTPVRTFTVTFPGNAAFDESGFARQVASHFGTDHTELVGEAPTQELLEQLSAQFDEPLADSSLLPTYTVSKKIREYATVALGGDGGDELFGGYPHYSWVQWQDPWRRAMPGPVRQTIARAAAALPTGVRGRNHGIGFAGDRFDTIAHINLYFDRSTRAELLAPLQRSYGLRFDAERFKRTLNWSGSSVLEQAMATDFEYYLPDDLLVKVDRASMLASLEVRAPFLDHRVIEFALSSVPDVLRSTRRERKILLRRLGEQILPAALDLKRKQGFSIPLARWLRDDSGRFIRDVLRDADPAIFDQTALQRLIGGHDRGRNNAQRIFAVMMFELWRRTFSVKLP